MNWNVFFEPRLYMSEVEYAELFYQGRMFNTECYLTKEQVKCLFSDLDDIECLAGLYNGCIITENSMDFAEAERLAEERGFGEKVVGSPELVFDEQSRMAINYN